MAILLGANLSFIAVCEHTAMKLRLAPSNMVMTVDQGVLISRSCAEKNHHCLDLVTLEKTYRGCVRKP